jgi:hypothetical protein
MNPPCDLHLLAGEEGAMSEFKPVDILPLEL